MHTITIPQLKQAIDHIALGMREPLMIWGQPGAGKTEAVKQSVDDNNGFLVDVRLGQYESVDLRGIPVPDNEQDQTVWYAPITLPFRGNPMFASLGDRPIYLFLDEVNQCHQSVFGVAMQLINEKRVGEHLLMDNVIIVAAGNREGDRAVANRMPTTVSNRFTHVEVGIDVDAWCHWAQEAGLPAPGIAFMQFRKNLLSTFDPGKPDKAFATPRTWEKALRYFEASMPEDIKQAAMAGAIGDGPAAEFWGFIDVWHKIPKMSDIEKNPSKIELPKEAAMRYAVTVAVSGTMNPKNVAPFATYLARLDPEFGVLAWKLAIARDKALTGTNEFVAFAKNFRAIFS